jgi:hypothetical protein
VPEHCCSPFHRCGVPGLMLREPPGRNETREMIHELVRARTERPRPARLAVRRERHGMALLHRRSGTAPARREARHAAPAARLARLRACSLASGRRAPKGKSKGDWGMWELRRCAALEPNAAGCCCPCSSAGERELLFDAIRRSNARIAVVPRRTWRGAAQRVRPEPSS